MNNRRRPTLLRVLVAAEMVVFSIVLAFSAFALSRYRQTSLNRYYSDRMSSVSESLRGLGEELQIRAQSVLSITMDVIEERELFSDSFDESYFAKLRILQEMKSYGSRNTESGYTFVVCEDKVYLGNGSDPNYLQLNFRSWVEDQAREQFEGLNASEWNVVQIDGKDYFLCFYRYADMDTYVGILTQASLVLGDLNTAAANGRGTISITDGSGSFVQLADGEPSEEGYRYEYTIMNAGLVASGVIYSAGADSVWFVLLLLGLAAIVSVLALALIIHKVYAKPIIQLSGELRNVHGSVENITINEDAMVEEIHSLKASVNSLLNEAVAARIKEYELRIKENELELMSLRSQIRPHFYLNAITTIDSLSRQNRNADIEKFIHALSVHVRYMLRTDDNHITLGEELKHIEAYITMQEIRYPNRVISYIEAQEGLEDSCVPHLLIYTVVENSFKYAIRDSELLMVMIKAEKSPEGVRVTVEDNGPGFSAENLDRYNGNASPEDSPEQKKHIGLRNIKRTLALKYERDDLFRISNHEPHGATVELVFPTGEQSDV